MNKTPMLKAIDLKATGPETAVAPAGAGTGVPRRRAELGKAGPAAWNENQGALVEIRWHGRGGQGVVTAGELLAQAALIEGKYFQSFPEFRAERTGAPAKAYTRISKAPIYNYSPVEAPDIVVVLDPSSLEQDELFDGLVPGSTIVVNFPFSPRELQKRYSLETYQVCSVDATRLSSRLLHRNLPNIPILGALLEVKPLVSKESMIHCIKQRFPGELATANITAFRLGYGEMSCAEPQASLITSR